MTVKEAKKTWSNEKADCKKEKRTYAVKAVIYGGLTLVFLARTAINIARHGICYGFIGATDFTLDKIDD